SEEFAEQTRLCGPFRISAFSGRWSAAGGGGVGKSRADGGSGGIGGTRTRRDRGSYSAARGPGLGASPGPSRECGAVIRTALRADPGEAQIFFVCLLVRVALGDPDSSATPLIGQQRPHPTAAGYREQSEFAVAGPLA